MSKKKKRRSERTRVTEKVDAERVTEKKEKTEEKEEHFTSESAKDIEQIAVSTQELAEEEDLSVATSERLLSVAKRLHRIAIQNEKEKEKKDRVKGQRKKLLAKKEALDAKLAAMEEEDEEEE